MLRYLFRKCVIDNMGKFMTWCRTGAKTIKVSNVVMYIYVSNFNELYLFEMYYKM